jgi:heme exporter protein CcmB
MDRERCAIGIGERCMASESAIASDNRAIGSSGMAARSSLLGTAWLITRKDLLIEFRSREIVYTTLFFAAACVLVFAFSFVKEGVAAEGAAAGILWISIAFSGTLALGRTFERERQNDTLRALMLTPAPRPAVYIGKLAGVLVLLAVVEAMVTPLVALMFDAPVLDHPLLLTAVIAAGTIGFAAVGTLFAAMLVRTRSRDVLLPILLYPITIPVIIAGVRGTAALFQAEVDLPMVRLWLSMLVCFDVVFVTLALWTFEPALRE